MLTRAFVYVGPMLYPMLLCSTTRLRRDRRCLLCQVAPCALAAR
jgi:hypothetical protein